MMWFMVAVVACAVLGAVGFVWSTCGCCCCQSFQVHVKSGSCITNSDIPGASVTIGSETETTNLSGIATFTSCPKPGDGISVTMTGFNNASGTIPTDCATAIITLTKRSSYFCCGGACPLPSTITGTDSNQAFTLTQSTVGGAIHYCGGYTLSTTGASAAGCHDCNSVGITLPVLYDLDCTNKTLSVTITVIPCPQSSPTGCNWYNGSLTGGCSGIQGDPPVFPCSLSHTIATSNTGFGGHVSGTYCPLNLTVNYSSSPFFGCSFLPTFPTSGTVTFTP